MAETLNDALDKILNETRRLEHSESEKEVLKDPSADLHETVFESKWLTLKKVENYFYVHEHRSKGKSVVVLVHDSTNPGHYYGRFERCPAHKCGKKLASLTGGVENDNVEETALHELWEEAGYKGKLEELLFLGNVFPYKAADTIASLYAWDAKGRAPDGKPPGDGSKLEAEAHCEWVTEADALRSQDPLLISAISYLKMIGPNWQPATMSQGPMRF